MLFEHLQTQTEDVNHFSCHECICMYIYALITPAGTKGLSDCNEPFLFLPFRLLLYNLMCLVIKSQMLHIQLHCCSGKKNMCFHFGPTYS